MVLPTLCITLDNKNSKSTTWCSFKSASKGNEINARHTLSPGVELKSPVMITEGLQLNLFEMSCSNWETLERRYFAWANFTSIHSGSLQNYASTRNLHICWKLLAMNTAKIKHNKKIQRIMKASSKESGYFWLFHLPINMCIRHD